MSRLALGLLLVGSAGAVGPSDDPVEGGNRYATTHSLRKPIPRSECADYDEEKEGWGPLKEFHFHTYFHLVGDTRECGNACKAAHRIRDAIVERVRRGEFVAVCDGITNAILPRVNVSNIPPINMQPRGPHPAGSFETWVPKEYVAEVLSFFMQQRGELSILIHPLSKHSIEDHSGRAMWLGESWKIDLEPLGVSGESDEKQYPELGLGYSAK